MAVSAQVVRVAIADDHVPTRLSLRRDLERAGIDVCAEAGNGDDAIAQVETERPDVCLIDVEMPFSGLDAAQAIKRIRPSTKVILVTAAPDEQGLLDAIDAGADGYLPKTTTATALVTVTRAVAAGEPHGRRTERRRSSKREERYAMVRTFFAGARLSHGSRARRLTAARTTRSRTGSATASTIDPG